MDFIRKIYHKRAILTYIAISIVACYYMVSIITNGNYSMRVLISNQNLEKKLEQQIAELQTENAELRKQLFEIKGLEP